MRVVNQRTRLYIFVGDAGNLLSDLTNGAMMVRRRVWIRTVRRGNICHRAMDF